MISLIIPPKDQISRVAKMLADEFGTASNIKSRVNRYICNFKIQNSGHFFNILLSSYIVLVHKWPSYKQMVNEVIILAWMCKGSSLTLYMIVKTIYGLDVQRVIPNTIHDSKDNILMWQKLVEREKKNPRQNVKTVEVHEFKAYTAVYWV